METLQVTITLDGTETAMLRQVALRELRKPRDQAHYLLRQALLGSQDPTYLEMHNRGAQVSEAQRAAVAA